MPNQCPSQCQASAQANATTGDDATHGSNDDGKWRWWYPMMAKQGQQWQMVTGVTANGDGGT